MSNNQLHGKSYEDHIKAAFTGAADHGRSANTPWDIEKQFDKEKKLPTSIKTVKNKGTIIIELADARKFWSIDEAYRMLVALYDQNGDVKNFHTLYEFLITKDEHRKMLNPITFAEVKEFHDSLLSYGKGLHAQARAFAKQKKFQLQRNAIVQLNQKIDSKTQRRLQCSIKLENLIENVALVQVYRSQDFYKRISVNFAIQSSEREFNE